MNPWRKRNSIFRGTREPRFPLKPSFNDGIKIQQFRELLLKKRFLNIFSKNVIESHRLKEGVRGYKDREAVFNLTTLRVVEGTGGSP